MEDLLKNILKVCEENKAEFSDIRIFKDKNTVIKKDSKKRSVEINERCFTVLRVLKDGFFRYATTTKINRKNLENIAKSICYDSKYKQNKQIEFLRPIKKIVKNRVKRRPEEISLEKKVNDIEEIFSISTSNKKIKSSRIVYSDSYDVMYFMSSEDRYIEQTLTKTNIIIYVNARQNDIVTESFESFGGAKGYEVVEEIDENKINEIVGKAVEQLNGKRCPKGNFPVVVDGSVAGVIAHEIIGHPSEADFIINERSFLSNLLGKEIANKNVSIIDDATIEGNGFYFFDHEGIEGQKTYIIKNGFLNSFLHSRETASFFSKKYNEKVRSTGNARLQGLGRKIFVRMSNTYFKPGDYNKEELFLGIRKGIYAIKNVCGMEDPAGKGFYVSCLMGYLIENSKITKPIRGEIVLTGNVLDLLKNITAVSKDFHLNPGGCGKGHEDFVRVGTGGPHIRIENITVGGI
jgi:TldD protein